MSGVAMGRCRGRRFHRLSVAAMLAEPKRSVSHDLMVAKMLARLKRYDESRPIFERVLSEQPRNVHVALDYADAMIAINDLGRARELVEDAKSWDPELPRVVRMDGAGVAADCLRARVSAERASAQ